ncbi:ferritin-like domain-containing protein [Tomitella fengzijianii]|uniref:DUF4439 domain-containing protein n=1 Tax=Tomitella fengzijianii TaxID=2597660 RepID=A0A516X3L7_9ACTN|nr:ferritin-like domain-containing protein [Tomitella fengzijianii]QDQ97672.1 DUF4439 domain-containing protein [Tomitella fengzijianii]
MDGAQLTDADVAALTTALGAEDGALYAYGTATAFAQPDRLPQIAEHAAAHRARRESVIAILTAAGAGVPPSAAGYTLPFPVDDPVSAARLAATSEHDCAVAWRSALEHAKSPEVRDFSATALADAAVRAGKWRVALGITPATVAFPGTPEA